MQGLNPTRLAVLLILLFLMMACAIPSINQQILLRTPLPEQDAPTPLSLATATLEVPLLPTAAFLPQEPFRLRGGVSYQENFAVPEQGCFWLGVAGQVFDPAGNPLENYVLVIEGSLKGEPVEGVGLTGTTDAYGLNGYEIVLAYLPVNSAQTLSIVLYDLNGVQLTNAVRFNTYADCTRNLVRIDFEKVP